MKLIQSEDRLVQQLQTNVRELLEPLVANSITQGHLLTNVSLLTGNNIVPTGLNRPLIGWIITRLRASATVYDNQNNNTTPAQNLLLISSAPVIVDIYVF